MKGCLGETEIPRDGFLEKMGLEEGVMEARALLGGGKACRNGPVCVEGMVWSRGLGSIRVSCVPLSKQPWELEQCGL